MKCTICQMLSSFSVRLTWVDDETVSPDEHGHQVRLTFGKGMDNYRTFVLCEKCIRDIKRLPMHEVLLEARVPF